MPILITTDVIFVLQLYFVNVKLSLSSEGIGGRDGIVLGILNLDTRWPWMVSFTLRPRHLWIRYPLLSIQ